MLIFDHKQGQQQSSRAFQGRLLRVAIGRLTIRPGLSRGSPEFKPVSEEMSGIRSCLGFLGLEGGKFHWQCLAVGSADAAILDYQNKKNPSVAEAPGSSSEATRRVHKIVT